MHLTKPAEEYFSLYFTTPVLTLTSCNSNRCKMCVLHYEGESKGNVVELYRTAFTLCHRPSPKEPFTTTLTDPLPRL